MRYLDAGAVFDDAGAYRYLLWRTWAPYGPRAGFILLNPSTAGEADDDPTVRRCAAYARAWGCAGMEIANLFAFRATSPAQLRLAPAPIGPRNDDEILGMAARVGPLCAGWGNGGTFRGRASALMELLTGRALSCLGETVAGAPRHPLYARRDAPLRPYRPATGPASVSFSISRQGFPAPTSARSLSPGSRKKSSG